jgi:hypothetical protein
MSDVNVKRLADHPWCAAAATPMSVTATQRSFAPDAKTMGSTASAHASIAVFRPALMLHPRLMSADDSQPPPMLPTSAMR